MCVKVLPKFERALVANSTTERFEPCTDWFPSTGVTSVSCLVTLRRLSGNFGASPAIQWVRVRPDEMEDGTWKAFFSVSDTRTTAGTHRNAWVDEGTETSGLFFMRLGICYQTTSGTAESYGTVSIVPTVRTCGRVVGADQRIAIEPGWLTSTVTWFEISEWFPLIDLQKVAAAILVEQCNAEDVLESRLGVRTAVDPATPEDWVEMETAFYPQPLGNDNRNTGELALPAGANQGSNVFGQLGLGFKNETSTYLRALVRASSAVRYT